MDNHNPSDGDRLEVDETDATDFEDLTDSELQRISENVRLDTPDGEMSLQDAMLDLAIGHNKIEQYKKGALNLHKHLDERLKEEEDHNPDSDVAEVIREVRDSAFGLYLRIQRGDEELHGERDGEYSGYFKD